MDLKKLELRAKNIILMALEDNVNDLPIVAGNSGGKDSAVLDFILKKYWFNYKSIYTNTTIDPKGTIGHIRKYYPHTTILQPKETFYQLIERKGLPTRLNRYCCEFLKEYASVGKMIFEGVRSSESHKRKGRNYIHIDDRKWQKGAIHVYPIYDWTDENVYEYIDLNNIILPPVYKYSDRLGCVACCAISRKGHREKELEYNPLVRKNIVKAITRGMAKNPQWKLTCATDGNGELAILWWLSGKTMNQYFDQYNFVGKKGVGWEKDI